MTNVILIMLDSLRRDHVGAYGNDWIETPNIDSLASEGVRFMNAHPEALPTIPVRRAMHTGMRTFPCRDYVLAKGDTVLIPGWQPIPEHQVTMAEVFRHHGYTTGLFVSTPHMFKPSMNFHRGYGAWEWIRGQEADRYRIVLKGDLEDTSNLPTKLLDGCVGHSLEYCLANLQDWRTEDDWFPARIFNRASAWLERNAGKEPFLLAIDEFDPHEPWNAPRDILEKYIDLDAYEGRRVINTHGGPYEFQEGELEYTLAQYAGEVTLCDKYVGVLMEKVKDLGVWDDTVIALVSDHGHNIMDHGVLHKLPDHMYPELMDLVYVVKSPEGELAGSTCDAYVAHHDIPVTLMEMVGVTPPEGVDGRNVWKWATGEAHQTRTYTTCIFYPWLWTQDGEHAYMTDIDGTEERLYDIRRDPTQHEDIAEENPELCKSLRERIWNEAEGDIPRYDIVRKGHAWYEYPDIHDPTTALGEILRKRYLK